MTTKEYIREKHTMLKPCCVDGEPDAHTVWLMVGVQKFCIGHLASETKQDAEWIRDRLAEALENLARDLPPNDKVSDGR